MIALRIGTSTLMKSALGLLLAVPLLTGGCGTVEKEKKSVALDAATSAYGKALRWGYYETAFGYIHPDQRGEMPGNLENVRVTAYDVVQPAAFRGGQSAEQMVHIEYVLKDEQVVNKASQREIWQWDEETNTWWLHSDFPTFD